MEAAMADVRYQIVRHDGGWAYRADGVLSETFGSHDEAMAAAEDAASRQRRPGEATEIEYEDREGHWHRERSAGDDRPETEVDDRPPGRRT
jgi:Uncharacterized protein conserved in bacteria (DUF2188)